MGIYLFVFIPLAMYSSVQTWILLLYPATVSIYLGNIVYSKWLGDPLDRNPKFEGPEILLWRTQLYRKIRVLLLNDQINQNVCPPHTSTMKPPKSNGGGYTEKRRKTGLRQRYAQDVE
jgi:hypothetical protein